jgi:hypothetical protein
MRRQQKATGRLFVPVVCVILKDTELSADSSQSVLAVETVPTKASAKWQSINFDTKRIS